MPFSKLLVVASLALLCFFNAAAGERGSFPSNPGKEIFVSPSGSDDYTGHIDRPLASLRAARDMIREIRASEGGLPQGGIIVHLRGGIYTITETVHFTERDSGTVESPIIYSAYANETPIFRGGVRLVPAAFEPVSDPAILERIPLQAREYVLEYDVSGGLIDMGEIPFRGHSLAFKRWLPRGEEPPELIFNGEPMTIARWPNEGFSQFARIVEKGSEPRRGARPSDPDFSTPLLGYHGNRPSRWATAPDAWVHGYWGNEWSDQTMQIESVSPEDRTIRLAQASSYGVNQKHRFFVFNLLEELDRPGEWYLDRENGMLYFYPPSDLQNAEIVLSQLTGPMLQLDRVSHMIFQGLTLEAGRGHAVIDNRGRDNLFYQVTIRNFAGSGIRVQSGLRNKILSSHLHSLGAAGITLDGGDPVTLTPGENVAENNHIHNFSRIVRTYTPGIGISGVGQRIAHNEIHDAPHMGARYSGNNHIFEYNKIYDIAKETGDVGGIYSGRSWTSRGTIIRYNLFHTVKGLDGGHGAFPVYFDDAISSALVKGNIIHGTLGRAVLIGGGHHIEVINNLFLECHTPVGIDARLLNWASQAVPNRIQDVEGILDRPIWLETYPELAELLTREPHPSIPHNNIIRNNLLYRSGDLRIAPEARPYTVVENNLATDRDPGFTDPENFDFSFPENSWLFREIPGFEPIPFHKIGRYQERPGDN